MMALKTFKGMARSVEGLRVEGISRGMRVMFDEPEELGGTNEGMNPVEMLLNALGACQVITAKTYARKLNINLQRMWVDVEGDLDVDGFMGVPGVKSGLTDIRFKMNFVTDAPEESVRRLVREVEKHCPVGATLNASVRVQEVEVNCFKPNSSIILNH